MDPRESPPDHPEDPFPPADQAAPPPPTADEDAEDFVEDEHEEDDEATLDEEEAMIDDDDDELDDLEAEADMDIEELRKKYGYGAPAAPTDDEPCASAADEVEEGEEGDETEAANNEAIESAANNYFGVENNEAEEEDVDYEPPEKKEYQIRIDPLLYQAAVPEGTEAVAPSEEHPRGTLLWTPSEEATNVVLDRFQHEWKARRYNVETDESRIDSRDDEDALFALLSASYSTAAAAGSFPFRPANQCERTLQGPPTEFSEEEKTAFETGFKDNYKNFRVIKDNFLPSRTLGELINYYYNWKKTSRFTEFRGQRGQRRDFMTEVMDQMESSKRRREATDKATESAAPTTTVVPSENDDDEIEYEDALADGAGDEPPLDVWPAAPQQEQSTESA